MIAYLKGILLEKHPPILVLDVDGVGYELEAPMTTFYDLTDTNTEVTLHTHMVVREDAQKLYGFTKKQQRDLFRSLLKVSGVGPRVGLAILSSLSTEEFLNCMADEDVDRLTRVPGIGRKTAQRLLVEMRDRVLTETGGTIPQVVPPKQIEPNPIQDAVSALIALGYKPAQASRAVREVGSVDSGSEEIIRQALRMLAGSTA